jgi:lysophospholipase L1-like esterase
MTAPSGKLLRRSALAVGCAGVLAMAGSFAPALASSTHRTAPAKPAGQQPVVDGSRYLALGDSVPFGYRESNSIPRPNYAHQKSFVGFPEDIASSLGLKVANAACPGETTSSFINAKAQSNGCENDFVFAAKNNPSHTAGKDYRADAPLHVKYASKSESQLTYAEDYLKKWPNTRLVTLMIGANDGFLCQAQHPKDMCAGEISALQKKLTKNVGRILKGLRNKAHYSGQIVLVPYYSFDYTNVLLTIEIQDVNSALLKGAKPYHVAIAPSFKLLEKASAGARGNTCAAGLLTNLTTKPASCGVHPSVAGSALLAEAVEKVIKK